MRQFSIAPQEVLASAWRERGLISTLIKRDVLGRYRGSALGILWSFFNPLLMLGVYTFVFSAVFRARWQNEGESKTEFALILFAGLLVFNLFSECVIRAPSLVLSNVNYVKKVLFPLEILPLISLGSALFHTAVSTAVWLIFYVLLFGSPPLTVLLFPVVILPLLFFVLGLSWLLASLGVYLRDVAQVIGIITTALMFLSPIFYPASALPQRYLTFLELNPLTQVIEQTRDVLIWGHPPQIIALSEQIAIGALLAWVGFAWFQKTRKGFADVL
jgi:lipopolysaccharide transport system permease protein